MKWILTILTCFALYSVSAATWVIHSCRDNAPVVEWSTSTEHWMAVWDLAWDLDNPGSEDSGIYHAFIGSYWDSAVIGYSDAYILDLPDEAWLVRVNMYGPYPDYSGWEGHLYWPGGVAWNNTVIPPSSDIYSPPAGEYWVDYDSAGSGRLSTTQPPDFGKWAWDGSINPSWVEPPLSPVIKKHGKGYNK